MTIHGSRAREDDGASLIEIVIAMVMLAALSLAFLPLLVQGIKQSAANATLATATQLINQRMQDVGAASTCAELDALKASFDVVDARGVTIRVATTVATCSASTRTVRVVSTATRIDTGAVLTNGATLAYVPAAS